MILEKLASCILIENSGDPKMKFCNKEHLKSHSCLHFWKISYIFGPIFLSELLSMPN